MDQTSAILTVHSDSQVIIDQSIQRFNKHGLQIIRSFDLQVARADHVDCTCPNHGTAQCDCQMVVLLIYGHDGPPATLVIHGHDGYTHLALVDTPGQRPAPQLVDAIVQAILSIDFLEPKIAIL